MKKYILFLLLLPLWAFTTISLTLMGPLKWAFTLSEINSWTNTSEKYSLIIWLLAAVIIAGVLAMYSAVILMKSSSFGKKFTVVGAPVAVSVLAAFIFSDATLRDEILQIDEFTKQEKQLNARIIVGPYPEMEKLLDLKDRGVTSVISLVDPFNESPSDKMRIEKERMNAEQAGLSLISLQAYNPDTKEVQVESIREVVRNVKGKYYIHSADDTEFAKMVKEIIQEEAVATIKGRLY